MSEQELQDLKQNSQMLGRIANLVSDFCHGENDTTYLAAARAIAELRCLQSERAWELVERLEEEQKNESN